MLFSVDFADTDSLAAVLWEVLSQVRLMDVSSSIRALFEPTNSQARKPLRRKVERAASLLAGRDLISWAYIYRPVGSFEIAPRPFVEWAPGDPETHLDALWNQDQFPFKDPYWVFGTPWKLVQVYLATPYRAARQSPSDEFEGYLDTLLADRVRRENHNTSWRDVRDDAAARAKRFLSQVAVFLHLRENCPPLAEGWRGLNMFAGNAAGHTADALILDSAGKSRLAIGFASHRFDLTAFHRYCRDRSLPYQIWGNLEQRRWFNAHANGDIEVALRAKVLEHFGPLKTIPALAAADTSGVSHP